MKVLKLTFDGPQSLPKLPIVGELYAPVKDKATAPNRDWAMTGTSWGVRIEKGDFRALIPWHRIKLAEYDPASVK
jgi:hypothetical protein